jgi:hypothetical protein
MKTDRINLAQYPDITLVYDLETVVLLTICINPMLLLQKITDFATHNTKDRASFWQDIFLNQTKNFILVLEKATTHLVCLARKRNYEQLGICSQNLENWY